MSGTAGSPRHCRPSRMLDCCALIAARSTAATLPYPVARARYCRPDLRPLAIASAKAQVSASLSLGRCLASMSHVVAISRKCCQSSGFAAADFASLRHSSARLVQSIEVFMRAPLTRCHENKLAEGRQWPRRLMPRIRASFCIFAVPLCLLDHAFCAIGIGPGCMVVVYRNPRKSEARKSLSFNGAFLP